MAGGPMETERITLSQRERDRRRVLHEVKQGHLTQREAGRRLRLSDRQVRRLLLRIGKYGDQAVIHGLRGVSSSQRLPFTTPRIRPPLRENSALRTSSMALLACCRT